jgi:hypothetical protein
MATFRFSETIVIFIGPMFVIRISESEFLIDTASVIGRINVPLIVFNTNISANFSEIAYKGPVGSIFYF